MRRTRQQRRRDRPRVRDSGRRLRGRSDLTQAVAITGPGSSETTDRPPLLIARQAGLTTSRGPVYAGLDLEVPAGSVVAIVGEAGRGRTSALMSLAGLMAPTAGELLRGSTTVSVARLDGVAELEPRLSVDECVAERLLLARLPAASGRAAYSRATGLLGLPPRDRTHIEDLTPGRRTLVAVAVALMSEPDVVVLDDLDAGADTRTQQSLWRGMRAVADAGTAVVATVLDAGPTEGLVDTLVTLNEPEPHDGEEPR